VYEFAADKSPSTIDALKWKPLSPRPLDTSSIDMDSLLVPSGGLDRRKQIQDAKDMYQTVLRHAERAGINVPPFEFMELIGKGSYGRVYKWYVLQ
jgi:hypothetical protein